MIQAKGISFRYPQEGRGLAPVSLAVDPGDFTLVSGPSGCGKSTLARCLTGLIPHLYHGELSGEVWLNGLRTVDAPMWQLAEKAGMVFQNPPAQMLAPSVADEIVFGLENLGLAPSAITSRLESVLQDFGLSDLRERSPHTLSGGEQQRLALAAIMARRPQALVLDEPLSMLDTTAAEDLIARLQSLCADGKALVIFEHRQEYLAAVPNLRHFELARKLPANNPQPDRFFGRTQENFSLEVKGLGVDLGGRTILKDLDLTVEGGQVVAVVGRNGVGKTTLLRVLSGLQKHAGTARVVSAQGAQTPDFGMVFQNPDLQLFNPSVREEMLYRLPDPDMGCYRWLVEALGLEPYESTPPLLLSEGEKKRLSLGLVLMRRPVHGVLLDEPSLGQDHVHKTILVNLLRVLSHAGQLVIMTTHDLTLAAQADRLILLGQDGIIADGPPDEVFQNPTPWETAGIRLPDWFQRERDKRVARCG